MRMGQHVWLLLATIGTEFFAITKWSKNQFPEPLPSSVKWAWFIGALLLVSYPTVQVSPCVLRPLHISPHPGFIVWATKR